MAHPTEPPARAVIQCAMTRALPRRCTKSDTWTRMKFDPYYISGVHEAAHCIASLDLQYPVDRVRIWRAPNGVVVGECEGPFGLVYQPRHEACIALAGPRAEARLTGEPLIDVLATYAQKDLLCTLNALARGTPPTSINTLLPAIE
jgi:hypothetical protein